jgi:hypothetical protein
MEQANFRVEPEDVSFVSSYSLAYSISYPRILPRL